MEFQMLSRSDIPPFWDSDITSYFPGLGESVSQNIELLKKDYSRDKHRQFLANYCFRCHQPALISMYNSFRMELDPQLVEPKLSRFYRNDAFIDLQEVGQSLGSQSSQYSKKVIGPVPKKLKEILDDLFETFGYIPNLQRFLLYYPAYLEHKQQVEQSLFVDGAIDQRIAYFLAFCGAAEMGCAYMMTRYFILFSKVGGNPSWINQGDFPEQFQSVLELNHLMGRAVWQITESTISQIYQNGKTHWSQSEFAAYIEIMAFSHNLSSISLAMGFNIQQSVENVQLVGFSEFIETVNRFQEKEEKQLSCNEWLCVVLHKMKQVQKNHKSLSKSQHQITSEEEIKPYMKQIGQQLSKQQLYATVNKIMPHVFPPHRVVQKRQEHLFPRVECSDYNFNFMAYPLLNSFTQQSADRLRSLLDYTQNMSRGNFGSRTISNTKNFRKAMIYYAENLCGYNHMEYDYKNNFSSYLTIALKFYIRLLMMSPAHITAQVIREIHHESGGTECFDLGHVAVLIASVKLSLQLTFTMRAFQFS